MKDDRDRPLTRSHGFDPRIYAEARELAEEAGLTMSAFVNEAVAEKTARMRADPAVAQLIRDRKRLSAEFGVSIPKQQTRTRARKKATQSRAKSGVVKPDVPVPDRPAFSQVPEVQISDGVSASDQHDGANQSLPSETAKPFRYDMVMSGAKELRFLHRQLSNIIKDPESRMPESQLEFYGYGGLRFTIDRREPEGKEGTSSAAGSSLEEELRQLRRLLLKVFRADQAGELLVEDFYSHAAGLLIRIDRPELGPYVQRPTVEDVSAADYAEEFLALEEDEARMLHLILSALLEDGSKRKKLPPDQYFLSGLHIELDRRRPKGWRSADVEEGNQDDEDRLRAFAAQVVRDDRAGLKPAAQFYSPTARVRLKVTREEVIPDHVVAPGYGVHRSKQADKQRAELEAARLAEEERKKRAAGGEEGPGAA